MQRHAHHAADNTSASPLALARSAFERGHWSDAFDQYVAADCADALTAPDLERLATAAYLIGRDRECADAWTRAHQQYLDAGDAPGAARCAYWLGFTAANTGDAARSSGWFARGRRVLEDAGTECAEHGYLRFPHAVRTHMSGDVESAYAEFAAIADVGRRFGDRTLTTMGRLGRARTLLHLGRIAEGLPLLDEVLVSITLGEVAAPSVGMLYCSALDACYEIFDLRRAQEWTAALTAWCESQPALVPYRGQCQVKRAELMQLRGAWSEALDEVRRARARLSNPPGQRAVGHAYYHEAELHRLRGEFTEAEECYRRATDVGRTPQPGLALLRLAQGNVDAAVASIRGELAEARDSLRRAALLPAVVEVTLAAGDVDTARAAANELTRDADMLGTPVLTATANQAKGAVLLHEGDAAAALASLRKACSAWQDLNAPYAAARARVLVGLAARACGDDDGAAMELGAARRAFEQIGAQPDARTTSALLRQGEAGAESELTARELQVLRLIAAGRTNRDVASKLMISEKTVARHVSNIFVKIGVGTRAGATAYAYEKGIV